MTPCRANSIAAAVGVGHAQPLLQHISNTRRAKSALRLALLEARGELDPNSPEADKLVFDFLKEVTMHEVGHTLGLRHNFRASTAANQQQIDRQGVCREKRIDWLCDGVHASQYRAKG